MPKFEFCLPTLGKNAGPEWLHEIKDDGLYEASRVKKFSRKTFFQEARVA